MALNVGELTATLALDASQLQKATSNAGTQLKAVTGNVESFGGAATKAFDNAASYGLELKKAVRALGESFITVNDSVKTFRAETVTGMAQAAEGAVAAMSAFSSGGPVLGSISLVTTGIKLATTAWSYFTNAAKEAAAATETAFQAAVKKESRRITGASEGDLIQATAERNAQRGYVQSAMSGLAVQKALKIPMENIKEREARLAPFNQEVLDAQAKLRVLEGTVIDTKRELVQLGRASLIAAQIEEELAKEKQQAAEYQAWMRSKEPTSTLGGTLKFMTAERQAANTAAEGGFQSYARGEYSALVKQDELATQEEIAMLELIDFEMLMASDAKRLKDKQTQAYQAQSAFFETVSADTASLASGMLRSLSGGMLPSVSTIGEGLSRSVKASAEWLSNVDNLIDAISAVPQAFKGIAVKVTSAVKGFAPVADTIIGVGVAALDAFQQTMEQVASAFKETIGAGASKLFEGSQAAGSMARGQAATGAMFGAGMAAGPLAWAGGPLVAAGAGAVGLASAFMELSTQTKSFKQVQQMVNLTVGLVINSLEPLWRNLLPLTAVVYTVTSGLVVFSSKLIPSAQIAEAAFEAVKQFGLGVLNVAHGLIGIINSIDNQLTGGKNNLSFESVDDALKTLGEMSFESALGLVDFLTATTAATDSLMNVPTGYKVALARFQAMGAEYGPGTGNDLGESITDEAQSHARDVVNKGLDVMIPVAEIPSDTIIETLIGGLAEVVTATEQLINALDDNTQVHRVSLDDMVKGTNITINTNNPQELLAVMTRTVSANQYFTTGSTQGRTSSRKRA